MGTELSKIQMKQQLAYHKTSCDLGEYSNPKEHQQIQHEWKLIAVPIQYGERTVIHKVENHDHQRPLMLWMDG